MSPSGGQKLGGDFQQVLGVGGRAHAAGENQVVASALALDVRYESTDVSIGQAVRANVRATYNGAGSRDQVIVRVGTAPGFVPVAEDLAAIVREGRAARMEQGASDVTFYLMGLASGQARDLSFRVVPSLAADVEAPASSAYVYYEPSIKSEVAPVRLHVVP